MNKVESFLDCPNLKTLSKNPTVQYNNQLKDTLKNCQTVFNLRTTKEVLNMNPMVPRLYNGLPKIH